MTDEEIEEQADIYANEKAAEIRTGKNSCSTLQMRCDRASGFVDGAKWGMEHAIEWHKAEKRPKGYKQDFDVALKVLNYNTGQIESDYGYYSVEYKKFYHSKFRFDIIAWCELPIY